MYRILQVCVLVKLVSVCFSTVGLPESSEPSLRAADSSFEDLPGTPNVTSELAKQLAQVTADYVGWYYSMAGRLKVMHIFYAQEEGTENEQRHIIKTVLEETLCKAGTEDKFDINLSCPVKLWGMPLICTSYFILYPGQKLHTLLDFRCKVQYADK